jgi:hypothetical protein
MGKYAELIKQFKELPKSDQAVSAYEFVRDLAYGDIGSRNPLDVLEKDKGTCSGKHALFKMILEELGFEVQSWFAKHNFGVFPVYPWPEALAEFQNQHIPDYHDFLKVNIDGNWQNVDAVFDRKIVDFGFPLLKWDGKNSMQLPVKAIEVFPSQGGMEEHKQELIAKLSLPEQKIRKDFLSSMTKWLDQSRANALRLVHAHSQ